ncbi:hypothetical protein B0H13DRAFT_1863986 [Mycena leptocephala]|nr:hypothetical protein B0H13DRAFT_1863986 [Mycena leptocephala]
MPQSLSPAGGSSPFAGHPPPSPVNLLRGPNALQGNALAALLWVMYDSTLTFDREIWSVWNFYFMETLMLDLPPASMHIGPEPCMRTLKPQRWPELHSRHCRTEIFCVLVGEALILLRINALYGWERKWIILTVFLFMYVDVSSAGESIVGIVTTVVTLVGGRGGLAGSTNILDCSPDAANVPDVNIAMWCTSLAVTLVLLMNLVLITAHIGFAQIGTPYLIATYTVASTRIFLNLKDLSQRSSHYNSATWNFREGP